MTARLDGKLDDATLWSNIDGVFAPRFPAEEVAFRDDEGGSINDIISRWVEKVRDIEI